MPPFPNWSVSLLLASASLAAQSQFSELRTGLLPFQSVNDPTGAYAAGDVDRDGDLDTVVAAGRTVLRLNDGGGAFTEVLVAQHPPGTYVTALVLADVDRDGDLDLLVGRTSYRQDGEQNQLFLGDGRGGFTDVTATHLPQFIDPTSDIAVADVDGDRDLDLIVANSSAYFDPPRPRRNRLYRNDGTGRFQDVTVTNMPALAYLSGSVAVADFDGDGDQDLLFGNLAAYLGPSPQDRLYLNDGRGVFADATAGRIPARPAGTSHVLALDADGDGDRDVVLAAWDQDRLLLNDGGAKFADATVGRLPADPEVTTRIAAADFDRDGDLDLVLAKSDWTINTGGQRDRLLENDGRGVFRDVSSGRLPAAVRKTHGVLAFDADGDAHVDLYFANYRELDRLLLNDRQGRFLDLSTIALDERRDATMAVALGDVDGDGDLDLAIGNLDFSPSPPRGQPNRLLINDGNGRFTDAAGALPAPNDGLTRGILLADLDGDGDLDQFHANWGQNRLWTNDGRGRFVDATAALPVDAGDTSAVAAGDLDGDGDLDLLLGTGLIPFYPNQLRGGQNRLYSNRAGVFTDVTATALPAAVHATAGVALGDVDGDGDLDAICANMGSQNNLYLNDGRGVFTLATGRLPPDQDYSRVPVLGDIDGDGDLDLVIANGATAVPQQDRVYRNDGRGRFVDVTSTDMPAGADYTYALVLVDVDLDGDLDMVRGTGFPGNSAVTLYRNDGRGVFAPVVPASTHDDSHSTEGLAAGDVDGDGDPDIVTGNLYQPNRLLFNLHRQLHAPHPLRLGHRFEIEIRGRRGFAPYVQSALPFANTVELQPRLAVPPLGRLGVALAGALFLQPVTLLPPDGVGRASYDIPRLPALLGTTVHTQALILQSPASVDWRLSNVVASPVRL